MRLKAKEGKNGVWWTLRRNRVIVNTAAVVQSRQTRLAMNVRCQVVFQEKLCNCLASQGLLLKSQSSADEVPVIDTRWIWVDQDTRIGCAFDKWDFLHVHVTWMQQHLLCFVLPFLLFLGAKGKIGQNDVATWLFFALQQRFQWPSPMQKDARQKSNPHHGYCQQWSQVSLVSLSFLFYSFTFVAFARLACQYISVQFWRWPQQFLQ